MGKIGWTTELKDLRKALDRAVEIDKPCDDFTWGRLLKLHEIGEYVIGEYHPWRSVGCSIKVGEVDFEKKMYHCWLSGNSISYSTNTLDEEIVECIAYKHDGSNSRAGMCFMKMIA